MMARALMIVGILTAMLVIPIYLKKEREDRELVAQKTEVERSQGAVASGATAASGIASIGAPATPRPFGHGLSFVVVSDGKTPPDVTRLSCHGEPAPLDLPHEGSCNTRQGDTSCRTVLPVLCARPGDAPLPPDLEAGLYAGWTGGALGATQPVMGAVLESAAMASERCEKELGPGWRMAELHDDPGGRGGGNLQGLRGSGLSGYTRYWVHVRDQKANCWDSAG